MAPASFFTFLVLLLLNLGGSSSARVLLASDNNQMLFQYHNGPLLTGKVPINLIWYGQFTPSQKAILTDFISSFQSSPPKRQPQPSVATWWKTTQNYYKSLKKNQVFPTISLANQISDPKYSLGKTLTMQQVQLLAAKGGNNPNSINVVLTSADVAVEGFCSSRCGTHGALSGKTMKAQVPYIWVGNSETQCPGQCAWPFHQPIYGPQTPPLVAPNNNVGVDGMVITLSGLLAGTATNPFGKGFYQGPAGAGLEAASACPGVYGKGAYPGYAGELLKDSTTGGSYNAHGVNGRKYLLPALYDPKTKSCVTLS